MKLSEYIEFLKRQKPNDGNSLVARSRIIKELESLEEMILEVSPDHQIKINRGRKKSNDLT